MKKTLTVNLGGTVFHIDEDAYRLLDNYLSNLKIHFRKEAGADEIIDDIERRISELFAEKLTAGSQVITITDVEEVIARMGKPEDMEAENDSEPSVGNATRTTIHRRLYRNPDDKLLGGVISGMAAYLGWDVTLLRLLLLVVLICGVGTLIPVYIVCWLVIPEARTAAEKLSMRGEAVTVENIGKTVTDGFEKVANGVNDYMKSDKPRTFLQKLGDALVMVAGAVQLGNAAGRMGDGLRKGAVVGHQQQALAVLIQAAHRVSKVVCVDARLLRSFAACHFPSSGRRICPI